MRGLKPGMNVSLDGVVATPDDGLHWMFPNRSPELMADTETLLAGFDAILAAPEPVTSTEHSNGVVVRTFRPRRG